MVGLKILINQIDNKIRLWNITKYYMFSWAVGLLSPGRIGELSIVYILKKKHSLGLGKGSAIFIIDRILSFIALFCFAIVGFIIFLSPNQIINNILLLVVILIIGLLVVFSKTSGLIIKKFVLRKYADKFRGFHDTLFFYLKKRKISLLKSYSLIVMRYIINSIFMMIIFLSIGAIVSPFYILIISATVMILSLIPITFNGIGLKEASAVFLYNIAGVEASIVLSVYVITYIIKYSVAAFSMLAFNPNN